MGCLFNVIFILYFGIDYKWNICEKDEYLKEGMKFYDFMKFFFIVLVIYYFFEYWRIKFNFIKYIFILNVNVYIMIFSVNDFRVVWRVCKFFLWVYFGN